LINRQKNAEANLQKKTRHRISRKPEQQRRGIQGANDNLGEHACVSEKDKPNR
jgi:hypothetical protein